MAKGGGQMKSDSACRTGLSLLLGYGAYAAANSAGYLNAMGTVEANFGFVSQLPFMMASCAAQVVVAFAMVLCIHASHAERGKVAACTLGYVLLLLGGIIGAAGGLVLPGFSMQGTGAAVPDCLAIALGCLRGAGSLLVGVAWYELLIVYASMSVPALLLSISALHASLGLAMAAIPSGSARQVVMLGLYAVSWVFACRIPKVAHPVAPVDEFTGKVSFASGEGRGFASAWLCLLVCQFVVGIANTAVFESEFAEALASVNVDVCILVATAVLAVLFVAVRHLPNPETTFKAVMPVLLAVFTVAALAAGTYGSIMGFAMIACYEAIAITYSVYLVQFAQAGRYCLPGFVALTSGAASLTLLLGLAIGIGLNAISSNHGVPLFTLLAFVAIYPLGLALLVMQRGHADLNSAAAADGRANANADDAAPARPVGKGATVGDSAKSFERRVKECAGVYGLTPRETELYARLVRGHTVKAICEGLSITENTAWTHIRSIYAKCGVKSKQALIEAFEQGYALQD